MSRPRLRRGDRNAVRLACALMALLPAAAWFSTQARADEPNTNVDLYAAQHGPRLCAVLDAYPTADAILGIADSMVMQDGFSYAEANQIETTAVYTFCPEHVGLLQQYIVAAPVNPAVITVNGHVGGALHG